MDRAEYTSLRGCGIDDVLITGELARRPKRAADYAAENRALAALAQEMAQHPDRVFQRVAELAMELCRADSAGISVLEPGGERGILRWQAAVGAFAPNLYGTMPREASPCGTVIARNEVLLFNEGERFFPALCGVEPPIYENLLAPWAINGKPTGTVWVIKHTPDGRFDAEDARLLESLSRFASAAYQMVTALQPAQAGQALLGQRVEERTRELLQTNEELRESENLIRSLVAHLPGGAAFVVDHDLRYVLAGGDALAAAGLTKEEFVGRRLNEVLSPALAAEYTPIYQQALAGEPFAREHEAHGRVYLSRGVPLRDRDGQVYAALAISYDITERRHAEETSHEIAARLRLVIESARDYAIFTTDAEGVVIDWYGGAERVFGYGADEMRGRSMELLFTPEDRVAGEAVKELQQARAEGSAPDVRWHISKDGRRVFIDGHTTALRDAEGRLTGFLKIGQDVSVRKRFEAALQESEERQAFLLEFSDALRAAPNEDAIIDLALRMLAEELELDRCYATVLYPEEDRTDVIREFRKPGLMPMPSTLRNSDFPEAAAQTFYKTLIFNDTANDPELTDTDKRSLAAMNFRAFLSSPLRHATGHPFWSLGAVSSEPRCWTSGEVALMEEATGRTWAAVERSRAERALRESREELAADLANTELLRGLAERLVTEESFGAIYDEVLSTTIAVAQADAGTIQIYHPDTKSLQLIANKNFSQTVTDYFQSVDASSRTACGIALNTGQRAFVDFPDEVGDLGCGLLVGEGFQAAMAVPLVSRTGAPLGMLNAHWRMARHRPTEKQLRFLDLIARQAADLIEQRQAERILRESEEQFRRAVEEAPIPVIMHAEDGQVLQISRTWTELTGFQPADIPTFEAWLNHAYGEGADAVRRHMHELFTDTQRNIDIELPVRTRTGEERHWSFSASSPGTLRDGRRFIVGMAIDITERKRAEAVLRESEARQAFLLEFSDALRALSDEAAIRELPVHMVAAHLRLDRCWLAEVLEREDIAVIGPDHHRPDLLPTAGAYRLSDYPGIMRQIATEPLRVEDVAGDPRFQDAERALLADLHIRALLVAPLRKGLRHVVWAFVAATATARRWTDGERALLEEVAERTWAAVERARAEAALRESEAKLRTALSISTVGVMFWSEQGRLKDTNDAFLTMTGFTREEALGKTWVELTPPEFHQRSAEFVEEVRATGQGTPYEKQYFRQDGSRWWGVFTARKLNDGMVEFVLDVTAQREAEAALRASEERFRLLVDNVQEYALFQTDPDGRLTSWNPGAERLFGYPSAEILGQPAAVLLTPDDGQAAVFDQEIKRVLAGHHEQDARWLQRKDGTRFWAQWVTEPVRDEAGQLRGVAKVLRDETDRQRADERQRLLIGELNHRVKNTLATVQAIANQTLRDAADPEDFATRFQDRLHALSSAHNLLTSTAWEGADVGDIVREQLTLDGDGDQISANGPPAFLDAQSALALALVLHELGTNARKYGALSVAEGRLMIEWNIGDGTGNARLQLEWTERGGPPVRTPERKGFGTMLVTRSLRSVGGQTELGFAPEGVRCRIELPLGSGPGEGISRKDHMRS